MPGTYTRIHDAGDSHSQTTEKLPGIVEDKGGPALPPLPHQLLQVWEFGQ
jgi:hypothetical protein